MVTTTFPGTLPQYADHDRRVMHMKLKQEVTATNVRSIPMINKKTVLKFWAERLYGQKEDF